MEHCDFLRETRSGTTERAFYQGVEPPPDHSQQTDAQEQACRFSGVQKIADGESDALNAVPRIHGDPSVSVVAGDCAHGKSGASQNQNDERKDEKQNMDFFHGGIRSVG